MSDAEKPGAQASGRFETLALPHLDAAYNLARWLSGSASDADDIVQEAFLRALRFFDGFRGESARAWLLAIVRNTWLTEWRRRSDAADGTPFDEATHGLHGDAWLPGWDDTAPGDPEMLAVRRDECALVRDALAALPVVFREVLVLREMEDMSYREIETILGVPAGTVMSRLARGRQMLAIAVRAAQDAAHKNTAATPNAPSAQITRLTRQPLDGTTRGGRDE
ncbi:MULTISPECIES: RNA polymerase sigma factor [Pandoraea]|uniref:RNA polymerase sigma factor n=1 Tax=Pandoraea communis TaxID=2508297 RepID=A0A5E4TFB2_9BURK|nr:MULTISPECIES: RNA polymerase sigma factor [Pandoraea]EON11397.1 RNA polymerase sigma factor [Pandoraea sp. SD6-2]VVD85124.1 RNA polymerase subunit sigma [Pandoraea communis]